MCRYGREGYGREGYGREGYGGAYSSAATYVQPPPVEYVGPESSDLGMGVRDSHVVSSTDYGAGYGRPEVGGTEYGDVSIFIELKSCLSDGTGSQLGL